MRIANPRGNAGRLRQNAAQRVILSCCAAAQARFRTLNLPVYSIVSVYFRNRHGVILASAGAQDMSVSSQTEAAR
jgi:hypothetical protein